MYTTRRVHRRSWRLIWKCIPFPLDVLTISLPLCIALTLFAFRAISFTDIYPFESTSHVLGKSSSPGCSIPDRFECVCSNNIRLPFNSRVSSFSLHTHTHGDEGDGCIPNETLLRKVNWHRVYGDEGEDISHSLNTNCRSRISTTKIQLLPFSSTMPRILFFHHSPPKHFTPDNSFMIPAFIHPFLTCLFQFPLPKKIIQGGKVLSFFFFFSAKFYANLGVNQASINKTWISILRPSYDSRDNFLRSVAVIFRIAVASNFHRNS